MEKVFFDESKGCNVKSFKCIEVAADALSKQLHEEDVSDGLATEYNWSQKGYRSALYNEALTKLKDDGKSDIPSNDKHFLIVIEGNG